MDDGVLFLLLFTVTIHVVVATPFGGFNPWRKYPPPDHLDEHFAPDGSLVFSDIFLVEEKENTIQLRIPKVRLSIIDSDRSVLCGERSCKSAQIVSCGRPHCSDRFLRKCGV
jgi:hypothetical protein